MRIGIFSDIHGNLEALEVVLESIEKENIDRLICLGDLVGYGPDPNLCVKMSIQAADITIAGNHDYAAINRITTENFNEYAREAIDWTKTVLNPESIEALHQLPLIVSENNMTAVHGTLESPSDWNYIMTIEDAYRNLMAMTTKICFIGHSHIPVNFIRDKNLDITLEKSNNIPIHKESMYLINVGSVGQPRDGDPRASYGILDMEKNEFHLKRIPYQIEKVQKKMEKYRLPRFLIERLAVGQ